MTGCGCGPQFNFLLAKDTKTTKKRAYTVKLTAIENDTQNETQQGYNSLLFASFLWLALHAETSGKNRPLALRGHVISFL